VSPFLISQTNPAPSHPLPSLIIALFLLFVAAFDLWTRRKVQRVTINAGSFVVVSQLLMFPIGKTALWHRFADWILKLWNASN